jgi:hypothetical protein
MNSHFFHGKKHPSPSDAEAGFHLISRDPYVDWAIILTVTSLAGLAFIVLGFMTFEAATARLNQSTLSGAGASVTFNEKTLTALLNIFDKRAVERAVLLKAYDGPGDPSL